VIIDRTSNDAARPFGNLLPIVEALVANGNVRLDGGFVLNQGGWQCRLMDPIDWNVVRDRFELPSNVELSEEYDSILDRLSWCAVEGPGARITRGP
jgi:hypothetical protein